jgi:hypothetical protein
MNVPDGRRRSLLPTSPITVGELATLMLVVALAGESFQLVLSGGEIEPRALETAAVVLIALVIGARVGRRLYKRERLREIGWLARLIVWHTDRRGVRYAVVLRNEGDIVKITLPEHVAKDDEHVYVLLALSEMRGTAAAEP